MNLADGVRQSISEAFVDENILKRKNLYIRLYSQVKIILIDESKRAYGVEVTYGDSNTTSLIKASTEVICSAGSFNSPQLLMVSGIGDPELLKKFNIPVILENSEVGKNLQDGVSFQLNKPNYSSNPKARMPWVIKPLLKFIFKKEGMMTETHTDIVGIYLSDIAKKNGETIPDMQLLFVPTLEKKTGYMIFHHIENGGFTIVVILLKQEEKARLLFRVMT